MKDVTRYKAGYEVPYGNAYIVKHPRTHAKLACIHSLNDGWNHVSVSLDKRTPTWDEMAYIKHVFFEDEDLCIQIHPKKSQYVNLHENCLHIWQPPEDIARLLL
jgi:hypothetical protein